MVTTRPSRTIGCGVGRILRIAAQLSAASLPSAAASGVPPASQYLPAVHGADLPSSAAPVPDPYPYARRVRPVGAKAESLLREGLARSATFSALVDALERSDLILYVTTGGAPGPSHLRLACAAGTARYVRITINGQDAEAHLISALAHELQHAIEIAGAPEVSDDLTLQQFYERHGQQMSSGRFCTREAQRTGTAVFDELCRSSSLRRR